MTRPDLPSTPPSDLTFRQILGAELALYWAYKPRSRNIWLALFLSQVVLLALFGLLLVITVQIDGSESRILYSKASDMGLADAQAAVLLGAVLACLWGLFEPISWPKEKRYRWSLPADRRTLDLARWCIGAATTQTVSTLVMITALVTSALTGKLHQLAIFSPRTWLALWLVPLLPFAWSSVLAVRGRRSKGVLVAVLAALALLLPLVTGHGTPTLSSFGESLGAGPLSLVNAIKGGITGTAIETSDLDATRWPAAFALWLGLAMAAFFALTRKRH